LLLLLEFLQDLSKRLLLLFLLFIDTGLGNCSFDSIDIVLGDLFTHWLAIVVSKIAKGSVKVYFVSICFLSSVQNFNRFLYSISVRRFSQFV